MRQIDFMVMKNGRYHDKQVLYYMTALQNELKHQFPNDINPNLSDPKYRDLLYKMPFSPMIGGSLAKSLGINDQFMTVELWKDLSNGYCPTAFLPKDSEMMRFAVDTPRGQMVKFNRSSTPIDANGEYRPDLAPKSQRIGTEFVYGLGVNTSNTIIAMSLKDPSVEEKFVQMMNKIFKEKIIPEMEKDAFVKKGNGGFDLAYAEELLCTSFFHNENRSEEPYLHFHFMMLNVAKSEHGDLMTVCNDLIVKNKEKYTAILQMALLPELKKEFGFKFKPVYLDEDRDNIHLQDHEKNVTSWDVADDFVPASLRDELGARTREIDKLMRKKGVGGFLAEEIARKESRDAKTELSPSELRVKWAELYDRHGFSSNTISQHQDFNQVNDPEWVLPTPEVLISNFLRKHKAISFSEDQFKAHVIKQLVGNCDKDRIERYAEEVFSSQCHQMLDKKSEDYFKDFLDNTITDPEIRKQKQLRFGREVVFTTSSVLEMDRYISSSIKERESEHRFILDKNSVILAMLERERENSKIFKTNFKFTVEQKNAILTATTHPGALVNISGRAGAGKSTLLMLVKDELEKSGKQVIGTAPSQAATENLAESTGMKESKCMNTSDLLVKLDLGKIKLNKDHVVVFDEAGMEGTENFYRIIKHVNNAGAKLILSGEKEQLQSVAWGGSYSRINDEFTTVAVKQINRQRDHRDREMVEDFASGRAAEAIDNLYERGGVIIKKTEDGRLKQIVHDYLTDTKPPQQKFIIAMTNYELDKINIAVREELKKQGKIPKEEFTIQGTDGIDREFSIGDRMVMFKNGKSDNVEAQRLTNSKAGTITGVARNLSGKPRTAIIEFDDGKKVHVNLNKPHSIKAGYAVSVNKSQGQTRENVYFWVSKSMNCLHTAYVACSRHKSDLRMYLSLDMVETLAQKMEGKEATPGMKKAALGISKQKGIELPPETLASFIDTREWLNTHHAPAGGVKVSAVLADFKTIIQSMSQTQFKKTSWDFLMADKNAQDLYKLGRQERANRMRDKQNIEPDFVGPHQPVHQVEQPSVSKSFKPNLAAVKATVTQMAKKAVDALASLNPAFKRPPVLESEIHVERDEVRVAIKPTKDLKPEVAVKKREIKKKNTLSL